MTPSHLVVGCVGDINMNFISNVSKSKKKSLPAGLILQPLIITSHNQLKKVTSC